MTAAATAVAVSLALAALVLVAFRMKVAGVDGVAAPAALSVGYGLIVATSFTGAGVGLAVALTLVLVPVVALVAADLAAPRIEDATTVGSGPAGSGIVAGLAAGAVIAMIGESLSLFGGLGRISTGVGVALILILIVWGAGLRGATAALRSSLAVAAGLAACLLVAGLLIGGPASLLGAALPPRAQPAGAVASVVLTVALVAVTDPSLRLRQLRSDGSPSLGLRRAGAVVLVVLPALTGAAVLFGGSFFSPSSQFFTTWAVLPPAMAAALLGLVLLVLGGLAVGYLEGAERALRLSVRRKEGAAPRHPDSVPPGLLLAGALAAVSGTTVGSPGALLLLASIAAAAALGGAAADPGTPVRRWLSWSAGAVAGGTAVLLGIPETLTFSWSALAPPFIAAITAALASLVDRNLGPRAGG